jgi:hypothetical protein
MEQPTTLPWDDAAFAEQTRKAVRAYWRGRAGQSKRQGERTGKDAGTRKEVTGGQHLNSFVEMIRQTAIAAGFNDEEILLRRGLELPGYFRPQKRWDLIAVRGGRLCAAVELKSQVGSFGKNFNNRSEEAIGNSTDFWTAFREGALGKETPWLGYFFFLELAPKSTAPVGLKPSRFPPFQIFQGTSYARRYEILCERLVLERKYTRTALLLSPRGKDGRFQEPSEPSLGFKSFLSSLHAYLAGCR